MNEDAMMAIYVTYNYYYYLTCGKVTHSSHCDDWYVHRALPRLHDWNSKIEWKVCHLECSVDVPRYPVNPVFQIAIEGDSVTD